MKKNIFIYLFAAAALYLVSCSRDLGNYDYQAVNEIFIDSLKNADSSNADARIYTMILNDTLFLQPQVSGSLSGTDTSALRFRWTIGDSLLSTSKDLRFIAKAGGRFYGSYRVTDNGTGLEKLYNFIIEVVNPFRLGYYFLTKNRQGEAVLYAKSMVNTASKLEQISIPDYALGKNPVGIAGTKMDGGYNTLTLAVKDAPYPVMVLDSRELKPILLYSSSSYIGDKSSFTLAPDGIMYHAPFEGGASSVTFISNNGKLYELLNGLITLPLFPNDPLDYRLPANGTGLGKGGASINTIYSFYDEKNQRIRAVDNQVVFAQPRNYTRMHDDIFDPSITAGQRFLYGIEATLAGAPNYFYLMQKDHMLYSYRLSYQNLVPSSFQQVASAGIPGSVPLGAVAASRSNSFWFIAVGNILYRASYQGLDLTPLITLPDPAARISHICLSNDGSQSSTTDKIVLSTWSPATEKSSVYIYNLSNLSLEYSEKDCMDEVVSVYVGL